MYPFKNVTKMLNYMKDKDEKLIKVEIQDQAEMKNQILCQFIKNHQICGKECSHQTEFCE